MATRFTTANGTQDQRVFDLFCEYIYIRNTIRSMVNAPLTLECSSKTIFLWARQMMITYDNLVKLSGGHVEVHW